MEARLEAAEDAHLKLADEGSACKGGRPCLLKGVADRRHAALHGCPQQRPGDTWEQVRVLVRVNVRHLQPGSLQASDLGAGFTLDLQFGDAATLQIDQE